MKNSKSFNYGLLLGEIIWITSLSKFTEGRLLDIVITQEQKDTVKDIYDKYLEKKYLEKAGQKTDTKQEWERYRDYVRNLHILYYPPMIEFERFIPFKIKNIDKFAKAIENYLWNTDLCAYVFIKDDIEYTPSRFGFHLKIKFTLDYLNKDKWQNSKE